MSGDALNLLRGVPLVESPLFARSLSAGVFSPGDAAIAQHLHDHGYAVIDFPDPDLAERIDRIKDWVGKEFQLDLADPDVIATAGDLRLQDAWKRNEDVRAIAANAELIGLLGRLYGRRAFPFQTLNFPVGTQQHPHSDSVHFSSLPERFMCGVWVALEDVRASAGPLEYYPGSHKWPITTNAMIGRRGWGSVTASAQHPFEPVWREMIDTAGVQADTFLARKGQALIWAANLLHGGCVRADRTLTRWSQVTHYYFDDCIYYTPAYSDEAINRLDMRAVTDIATGNIKRSTYLGESVYPPRNSRANTLPARLRAAASRALRSIRPGPPAKRR